MNHFLEKKGVLAIALALGMICLSCATAPPKPEAPPPPRPFPESVSEGEPPAPPAAVPVPREASPAPERAVSPVPVPPAPLPSTDAGTKPQEDFYIHSVKWSGETVSIIAAWYTGEMENWKILAEANPEVNPNRIYNGVTIRIPQNLLKTREPMPREFLDRYYSKSKKEKPRPKPQTAQGQEEEPKLFGPKKYPKK